MYFFQSEPFVYISRSLAWEHFCGPPIKRIVASSICLKYLPWPPQRSWRFCLELALLASGAVLACGEDWKRCNVKNNQAHPESLRSASDARESSLVNRSRSTVKSERARTAMGEEPLRWMISRRLAPMRRIFSTFIRARARVTCQFLEGSRHLSP